MVSKNGKLSPKQAKNNFTSLHHKNHVKCTSKFDYPHFATADILNIKAVKVSQARCC